MRWPWQRRHADAGDAEGTGERAPAAVQRPRGQWRGVEPLHPVGGRELSAAEPLDFVRTLSTRWQVPPALEPLGHEVSITAPAGHVPVAGAPVTGYPDPPELVWATVPEVPADDATDTAWRRAPARVEHPLAEPAPAVRPRPEDVAAPLPAPRSAPVDVPGQVAAEPQVRDLVGDQDPLPLQRSRRPEVEVTTVVAPVAGTPSDDDAAGPTDLPLRRAVPPAQEVVAARAETPLLVPPSVAGPRQAHDEVVAPLHEPHRAALVDQAGPATAASPVPPEAPAPAEAPRPVRAEPDPDATVRTVRPVVGRRRALADAPSLRPAAEQGPDLADAPRGAEPEPQPSYDRPSAPGLGVPDWFSSGPLRPTSPEPDPVPGAVQRPAAREAVAPVLRRSVEHLAAPAAVEDRAAGPAPDLPVARGPRRVAWPLDTADEASTDDEPEQPDDATTDEDPDDAPGTDDADAPPQVAALAEQVVALASPVARRVVRQDAVAPELRITRSEPAPAPASPRRFRVGAPLPRPASARPVPAPSGLAAFAAASAAAAGAGGDGPSWDDDTGLPAVDDDVPEPGALRARLLPSDLGLPGPADDAPAAPARAADPPDDADDLDDDDPTPSADEIYEQVRTRLRHELMVDRERAALLVD